jgi:hypothetical protein
MRLAGLFHLVAIVSLEAILAKMVTAIEPYEGLVCLFEADPASLE